MDGLQPQTIADQPIPLLDGGFTPTIGNATNPVMADSGASSPNVSVDQRFPPARVAQETIAQSLNTETKRILADYSFESLGAISIGEFIQGVSGDIKLSPDGIVAENVNGETTFALDGATGDATFKGEVKAGSVVTGAIVVGDNRIILDGENINIIFNDGTNDRAVIGLFNA